MAYAIHIAEVAALLAIAYAIGWTIGYFAHRLAVRVDPPVEAIPPERIAAVLGEVPDALVKAPVIVPVASDPPPPVPTPTVVPAVAVALPEPPAVVAIDATPAEPSAAVDPAVEAPAALVVPEPEPVAVVAIEPAAPALEPAPAPVPAVQPPPPARDLPAEPAAAEVDPPEPAVPFTATPAARPGEAWSGEIRGRAAGQTQPPVPPEPTGPATPSAMQIEIDEAAAMRAIEGGSGSETLQVAAAAQDLAKVGAAVAAAQAAVAQMLSGTDPDNSHSRHGKPAGLPRPRPSGRDDLKQINGLGGLDESTLNNLGVYHFDQIAGWSETDVLWMENHVFARGRIGRENWQAQARDLASTVAG